MFIKKLGTFRLQSHRLLSSKQKLRSNNIIFIVGDRTDPLTNYSTTISATASSQQRFPHANNNLVACKWHRTFSTSTGATNAIQSDSHATLAVKFVKLDLLRQENLKIVLQRGRSGMSVIQIHIKTSPASKQWLCFPNISVPEDAYTMVREMDELIATLPDTAIKRPTDIDDESKPVILPNGREFDGKIYGYRLDMCWWRGKLKFYMSSVQTVQEHREKKLIMPARALPLLRNTMAQMLVEHDGTQELPPAAKIPTCILVQVQETLQRMLNAGLEELFITQTKNVDEQKKMELLRKCLSQFTAEERQQLLDFANECQTEHKTILIDADDKLAERIPTVDGYFEIIGYEEELIGTIDPYLVIIHQCVPGGRPEKYCMWRTKPDIKFDVSFGKIFAARNVTIDLADYKYAKSATLVFCPTSS